MISKRNSGTQFSRYSSSISRKGDSALEFLGAAVAFFIAIVSLLMFLIGTDSALTSLGVYFRSEKEVVHSLLWKNSEERKALEERLHASEKSSVATSTTTKSAVVDPEYQIKNGR